METALKKFSTVWKTFFHSVEKMRRLFPQCGKLLCGACLAAGLVWGATGCQSVKASRLSVPKAEQWTASASASQEGHGPELALDGSTNTWWHSGAEDPQWIQVNLGRVAMVCGFSLQWGDPHAVAYSVLTSRDGVHWALGYETTGGDGDWDQVSIEPTLARCVRVVVTKSVRGEGAALAALEIQGLADQPVVWVDGGADPRSAALLDGNPSTVWVTRKANAVVELDLRSVKPVGSVRVDWGTNGFASNVVVEISTNRVEWMPMGTMQAHSGDFDVLMNNNVHPARHVRFSFSGSSGPDGFGVAGITLRGTEGAARPWAMYELAASHAPEGVYPDVLWRRQNYWVVAGGTQRGDPESALDEWGVFAPSMESPTLVPLVISDGVAGSARQAEKIQHRLGGDGAPMPEVVWTMPSGLSLRTRVLVRPGALLPATWIQYELANESLMVQTGRLCWVARPVRLPPPWAGGGLAPIYRIRRVETAGGWQELWANEEPIFAIPGSNIAFGATAFRAGDAVEFFLDGEVPPNRAANDAEGLASAAWWVEFSLNPGERMRYVVAAPAGRKVVWPAANGEEGAGKIADWFDREWVETEWSWRAEAGRYAPKIDRPDAADCLHAQVGWMMSMRGTGAGAQGEEVESIQARVAALLRAGQPVLARNWIEQVSAGVDVDGWVPAVFRADGLPAHRMGQESLHASQGQFAFMVMEYFRFTQDAEFLHQHYPVLKRTLEYVLSLRKELEKTEWRLPEDERYLLEGLLPPSGARAGSSKPVHLYSDHYWTLLAWKEGRLAASILGLDQDAAWADEQYRLLRSAVRRSLRASMDKMEGNWIPASAEEERMDAESVALLVWPCEETDLVEPHELQSSLDAFYADFLLRSQPGWAGQIPSDESLMLTPLAQMSRGDYAREVLYALLDRRQPREWHTWADVAGSDPRHPGQVGPMPDVRVAATYFIAVRGLAARESGKRLELFSGAPAEWLQHGEGFRTFGMPTAFGPLDLSGYWTKDLFTVEIDGGARPPEGYRIWWPRQIAPERVLANGKPIKTFDAQGAMLPHDFKGKVEVVFPFLAPWPRDP